MIGSFRPEPQARTVIEPEAASLFLFWRDLQPFAFPDPLNPFVVHVPARVAQQTSDDPISITAILAG